MKITFPKEYPNGNDLVIDTTMLAMDLQRAGYDLRHRNFIKAAILDVANREGAKIEKSILGEE